MRHSNHSLRTRHAEEGTALVALFVVVLICGGLALSVLLPNIARHGEASAMIERERSFQLAEAGVDWGIAEIRKVRGVPAKASSTVSPGNGRSGSFTVRFAAGDANGRDDDGDGITDEPGESLMVQMTSTGTFDDTSRTIRVMMRPTIDPPGIVSAMQFNVENPIVDLKGNSLRISGVEHELDQSPDTTRPAKAAISAPTDPADLASQIHANNANNVVGAGGTPSTGHADAIDLDTLVEQARTAATTSLAAGTYSQLALGAPTEIGAEIVICEGDLHLTGQFKGAGILVVDGDLKISGQGLWVGILIVRGRCELTGGGSGKHIVGSIVIGEEFQSQTNSGHATVSGTADILYSTDAIDLVQKRLGVLTVLSWQEVANP